MIPKLRLSFLDRLFYSLNWILIFSASLLLFYMANFSDKLKINPKPEDVSPQTLNIFGFLFFIIGIIVFYKNNKKFKLSRIDSNLSINKKIQIIELISNEMKYVLDKRIDNEFKFYDPSSLFRNDNNVTIIIDDNAFWINVLDADWASITFGAIKRNEKRLKNRILKHINS